MPLLRVCLFQTFFVVVVVNSEHIVERVIAHHHCNGAYMRGIVSSGVQNNTKLVKILFCNICNSLFNIFNKMIQIEGAVIDPLPPY